MTTEQSRRAGRVVGLAGMFAGLALGLLAAASPERTAAAAVPSAQPKEIPNPPSTDHKYVGAVVCQGCHNEKDPKENPAYLATKGYEFIRLWENRVWGVHDLHSTAYKNLLTDRTVKNKKDAPNKTAQKMEDNLRRFRGESYTVATDKACLACHASVRRQVSDAAPASKWTAAESFSIADGVGCEMCHGQGSGYQQKHQESQEIVNPDPDGPERSVDWREWPPAEKKKWGLVDLRNPVEATTQCASCHVGNTRDGRFVTHEMFAAGHPPLPPLDLIAYTREQPRHWGLPAEMPYLTGLVKKNPKKAEDVFHIRKGESHVARRFVESAVATLRASVVLGGQLASEAKDDGMDFAAFDCASCHHNLKYPSDRQARGYVGKPGRPLFRPAAFELTKVIIGHAAEMEGGADLKASLSELIAAEQKLATAFTNKTYGDGPKVKEATDELQKWSEDALKKLAAVRYTPAATQGLLAKVVEAAEKPVADPEVAQLYTWAFETLVLDLIPPTKDKEGKLKPPPEVATLRDKLKTTVVTRLRPDALFHYEVEGGVPGPNRQPVDERIGARMKLFYSFDDAVFRKAFQDVLPLPKP
ncbi:multiheme c-type cytochrome [Frigoriglobus tundricola]|uniref:Cytochrome c-552/4 domain-containing protein n=1 Tax=Frigoriglobus tundricola TaxID=2774151 RepID=A0A6M5YG81_9BACT|nr:multiheme c-type cytochrome [Frigoriglobus tundricola]QJW93037.1 hypothetical protein FTUN_0537 [Frigoriglobus tundricola]